MRPIKFRAWDGKEMQLFALHEKPWPYSDEWPVMQFTGLLDKNGKEIYEGDVVRMRGGSTFMIRFDVMTGQFGIGHSTEHGSVIQINSDKDEVIGNIYENPNLLTP